MHRARLSLILSALLLLALGSTGGAQEQGRGNGPRPQGAAAAPQQHADTPPRLLPADATTHHRIVLAGRELDYTATAGTLPVRDDKGVEIADIFFVAFTLDGVPDMVRRPITYAFNGGPGAASAYLDIGALGPRALDFGADGAVAAAPGTVSDNPDSWLPFTDLVFIDPVGTGYSRAVPGHEEAAQKLMGVRADLDALAQVIRVHIARTGRAASPFYLVGESYGGFRAARLAEELATEQGIAPTGIVLVSPVLEFRLMESSQLDVLSWALRLPSYAAVALSAQGSPPDPVALASAERFALTDYLTGIAAGPTDPAAAAKLYAEVAHVTGLDEATVARWHGRIPLGAFVKGLHRSDGRILSRYDGTVTAPDPNPWSERVRSDPVLDGSIAPFTRAFTSYAESELGVKTDLAYELLSRSVGRRWDWHEDGSRAGDIDATEALYNALSLEPKLRVLIAHGLTDLQTPYMMSRYVIDHLPAADHRRTELKLYDGGHMMYMRSTSRHRLHDDAAAFYAASTS